MVDVRADDGKIVGNVQIPSGLVSVGDDAVLSIRATYSDLTRVNDNYYLRSAVTDITLESLTQGSITKLDEPLTICLQTDHQDHSKQHCLGYYEVASGKWECEDRCLEKQENGYCGTTGHLTAFALLLDLGSEDGCNETTDRLFVWLSAGFLGAAIVLIILAMVAIEVYVRLAKMYRVHFLRTLSGSQ